MRRLIICADGTWNSADMRRKDTPTPTNVIKMARAICPVTDDGVSQIIYYHEGVGNGFGVLDRFLGGAFGVGLSKNIRDCYRFLVDNHQGGDEIFLFGFSRGAFTVRSLSGLIRKCGLLSPNHTDMIPDAYRLYRNKLHPNHPECVAFRAKHSKEVRVKLIGVWDTVGALGVPTRWFNMITRLKYGFHDVTLSSYVDNAFHALAIDERRKPFAPTLWETRQNAGQRFEQVWFPGSHSNVGGGLPDAGLSDLAFAWMAARAGECGLNFDQDYLAAKVRSAADAELENSFNLFWHPLGPFERKIGEPRPNDRQGNPVFTNESIDPSVDERMRVVTAPPRGPYVPKNVAKFRQRVAGPAPESAVGVGVVPA